MRWLMLGVGAVIALGTALWTAPRWLVPRLAARSPRCLYLAPTGDRVVALTLDDGPDPVHTPVLLEVLRAHGARATFFVISGHVPGRETVVRSVVAEGHELGNHLTRDEASIDLSRDAFAAAMHEAGAVLAAFGPVRWLRPGSAWYDDSMLDAMEHAGYRCALGSIYPYDVYIHSPRFAAAYIMANARPGSVIVLHEGGDRSVRTAEVLRRVLPALRARGFRVVTLSELDAVGRGRARP